MSSFSSGVNGFMQGAELGMRMRDREDNKAERERQRGIQDEERAYNRSRLEKQDARLAKQDEDLEYKSALDALDLERKDALAAMEGDIKAHGGIDNVPEDVRKSHQAKAGDLTHRRSQLLRKKYEPIVKKKTEAARTLLSGLQDGTVDIDTVAPGDLVEAVTMATKRSPVDFLKGDDGAPSKIEQALQATMQGMKSGDQEALRSGVNILMQPELMYGIGDLASDGSEITAKEIDRFIPAEGDPERVYPVLKVKTKRSDGAEGSYLAPRTHGRTSHEDDDVAPPMKIGDAMDRAGRLGALAQVLNAPDVKAKLMQGLQEQGGEIDSLLKAVYATGGNLEKLTGKLQTKVVNLGDRQTLVTTDEQGNVVKETNLKKGVDPEKAADRQTRKEIAETRAGKAGPEERKLGVIQDYAEEHGITEEEAAAELQDRGVLSSRGAGKGSNSGGGKLKETDIKGSVQGAMKQILADIERRPGKSRGEYMKPNGAPATPLEIEQINAAEAAMDAYVRETGKKDPSTLVQVGRQAAADHVKSKKQLEGSKFEQGKIYVNGQGKKAKYGGKDPSGKDIWLKA